MQNKKTILLIITGSIAAYKSLDLIRLIVKDQIDIKVVLTDAAKNFVTPMSVAALSQNAVYDDILSLKDESEMGHIQLAKIPDLVVVAPASADIIGKIAHGMANDLASSILLTTKKKIIIVPAMNCNMWENKALQRNVATVKKDGIEIIGPDSGSLACGDEGMGKMVQVDVIYKRIKEILKKC